MPIRFLSSLLILAALFATERVALGAPDLQATPGWYYVGGRWDGVNILVTCTSKTTIFRTISFNLGVPVAESPEPEAEVEEACRIRDELLAAGFFNERTFFGQNDLLDRLVKGHQRCLYCTDLNDAQREHCSRAYFASIDWLLDTGVDIDGGQGGTVLSRTILELNEEMYYFLLSRGADPGYRPPQAFAYRNASPELEALVDTTPRSAIERLELYLSELDEAESPDLAAAWRRMLGRALGESSARE